MSGEISPLLGDGNVPPPNIGQTGPGMANKGPIIMSSLMKDLGLTKAQAAGVVGNLAHETGDFKQMQEVGARGGRGGFGWAQWTGPRRREFEAYAQQMGLDPRSDQANLGFLEKEIKGSERGTLAALQGAQSPAQAAQIFEQKYERASVVAMGSRVSRANAAFGMPLPPTPPPNVAGTNVPMSSLAPPSMGTLSPPPAQVASLAAPTPNSSITNIPRQPQVHQHQLNVDVDGHEFINHMFESMIDTHPAASSSTTGFDYRMSAISPGTSIRG
jgi:hypothetical protein